MSTRSFVYVKIKEEDKGTKKKADLIKVGLLDGDTLCHEDKGNVAKDKIKDVELNGNYIILIAILAVLEKPCLNISIPTMRF